MGNDKSIGNEAQKTYHVGDAKSKIINSPEGPKTVFEPSYPFPPNLTDIAIYRALPSEYDPAIEQRIEEIATKARLRGSVKLIDLAHLLAREDNYISILAQLWKLSGFNDPANTQISTLRSHDGKTWTPSKVIEVDSVPKRLFHWYWLLWRWVARGSNIFENWEPFLRLPLYNEKDKLPIIQSATHFIRLRDLKEYFDKFSRDGRFDLPVPSQLFEAKEEHSRVQNDPQKENYVESSSVNSLAEEVAQKVAQKIDPIIKDSREKLEKSEKKIKTLIPDAKRGKKVLQGAKTSGKSKNEVYRVINALYQTEAEKIWNERFELKKLRVAQILAERVNSLHKNWDEKNPLSELERLLSDNNMKANPDTIRKNIKKPPLKPHK